MASKNQNTIRAYSATFVASYAPNIGMEPSELLQKVRINPDSLGDKDRRIDYSKVLRMWKIYNNFTDDPLLGARIGRDLTTDQLGLVGYSMKHSPTLRSAFQKLEQFSSMMTDDADVKLIRKKKYTEITVATTLEQLAVPSVIQCRMGLLMRSLQDLTGQRVAPEWIRLPKGVGASENQLAEHFQSDIILQDQGMAFALKNEVLDRELETSKPELAKYLTDYASVLSKQSPKSNDIVEQVRQYLLMEISKGQLCIDSVAAHLNLSERSLQRRLNESRTTFSKVVEEFRAEYARQLIANQNLPITQIASLLGYNNTSSFYRAFQRWSPDTPQQLRKQLTQ